MAALSRALGTAARRKNALVFTEARDSEARDDSAAFLRVPVEDEACEPFSVLAFGAQVEAQAVRRFEWDAVKRRRFSRSRLGFGAGNAGTGRTEKTERTAPGRPDTAGPGSDDFLTASSACFRSPSGWFRAGIRMCSSPRQWAPSHETRAAFNRCV